eukprot:Ihof_evm8s95 gene=Ihof_evmTU8s95
MDDIRGKLQVCRLLKNRLLKSYPMVLDSTVLDSAEYDQSLVRLIDRVWALVGDKMKIK